MDIKYPKDTPEWLKDTIKNIDDQIRRKIVTTPVEQFLVIKGQQMLFLSLCEEIDALGHQEAAREKEITENATRR